MSKDESNIFPSRFWLMKWGRWLPFWRGSDEWGRHTIVVQIPGLIGVVIATHPCTEPDMQEFACTWPGCPHLGMVPGEYCPTHDRNWLSDEESPEPRAELAAAWAEGHEHCCEILHQPGHESNHYGNPYRG